MAPKNAYTEARMENLAKEAVAKYIEVRDDGATMKNLSCTYLGIVGEDESSISKGALRQVSKVAFEWKGERNGTHTAIVQRRCDNACRDGVPFPRSWHLLGERNRMLLDLKAVAQEVTARQKAPCEYLGLELANGGYEEDPKKWKKIERLDRTVVHFEWASLQICGLTLLCFCLPPCVK